MPESPPAPVNVRAVYEDGTEVPLECYYYGINEDDNYVWIVMGLIKLDGLHEVRAEELPAHTEVNVNITTR